MHAVVSIFSWTGALMVLLLMTLLLRLLTLICGPEGWGDIVKALCRLLVRCFPFRVEVEGLHRLDRRKPYIFIANHVNILDAFMLIGFLPWHLTALERVRHFAWPLYGSFIRSMGHIPIDLDSGTSIAVALRRADRALRAGTSVIVMPEGNWTYNGALGKFGRAWARLIKKVYEVDPLTCPRCGQPMKVLAVITDLPQVMKILRHLLKIAKPPPGLDPAALN